MVTILIYIAIELIAIGGLIWGIHLAAMTVGVLL